MAIKPIILNEQVSLTYKEWEEQFKPSPDTYQKENEDLEFVKSQDPRKVWTWIMGDEGDTLVNGLVVVESGFYNVCENLWDESKDYEVVINIKVECQCYDSDQYDTGTYGYENCFECEGTGYTRKWMSQE